MSPGLKEFWQPPPIAPLDQKLATAMRADPRFAGVPIVMITSRTGDKHRQRALEIGVQRYMGKPYQELDLMRNVYDLLGIARVRE